MEKLIVWIRQMKIIAKLNKTLGFVSIYVLHFLIFDRIFLGKIDKKELWADSDNIDNSSETTESPIDKELDQNDIFGFENDKKCKRNCPR